MFCYLRLYPTHLKINFLKFLEFLQNFIPMYLQSLTQTVILMSVAKTKMLTKYLFYECLFLSQSAFYAGAMSPVLGNKPWAFKPDATWYHTMMAPSSDWIYGIVWNRIPHWDVVHM